MPAKLTAKQTAFVEHYLTCWNATEAARRAGYSAHTANQQGPRLLVNVGIEVAIAARLSELKMSADEVLTRLSDQARANMDDFVVGDYLNLERARDRGKMHLIKKLKVRTTTISKPEGEDVETHDVEVELYDAQAALVHLGRHHKLFTDKIETKDGNWEDLARKHGLDPDKVRAALTVAGPLFGDKAVVVADDE